MSTITWLHLSDLHFRKSQAYDATAVLKALLRDLLEQQVRPDFVAISGDIAFSGQPAEYDQARRFFDDLLSATELGKDRLFLVPGNHDVDRSLISPGTRAIGDSLSDRKSANTLLDTVTDRKLVFARFKGYAAFVRSYLGNERRFDDSHYFYVQPLNLAGKRVALLGLNSDWLCASDQDKANGLLIGKRQARTALEQAEGAHFKIALLHHPFDWLREFDQNDSAAMLIDGCDFILHGHLHQAATTRLTSPDGAATILACGACYETREFPNMYNWVGLDLAAGTGTGHLRRYSDARGGFWAPDTLTYQNAPTGEYKFRLSDSLLELRVGEPTDQPDALESSDQPDGESPRGRLDEEKPAEPSQQGHPRDAEPEQGASAQEPKRHGPHLHRWANLLLLLALSVGITVIVLCCLSKGGRIAFASGAADSLQIYVMNADGRNQTRLTDNGALNESPVWSPDGKRLAFHSQQDGNFEVYVMDADGTGQTNLTNSPPNDGSPSWSPDGRLIAFDTNRDDNVEIYLMNADGSGLRKLANNPTRDALPAWSPDGKQIAFVSRRDDNDEIYVMNADGSNQRRLTFDEASDENPVWSPDGKLIAFFSYHNSPSEIYVMNADGSGVRRLTDNIADDGSPSWSPDGKRIAFDSN